LYILSNFNRASFEVLKRFHAPILDLFDGYVIAGQVGYAKPDQRIYEHLLDKYGLRASACVFVDDEKEKVAAACAVGMSGVVCDTVTTVEQAFAEHGVFKLE
jgi:FMN phosphatase YigB (HAD superfamily)